MKPLILSFKKVSNPATYKQICELFDFDNVKCSVSKSQLLKRLQSDECDKLIEALKEGENVEIIGY